MTFMERVSKIDEAIIKWGDENAHYITERIGLPRLIAQSCYAVVASSVVLIAMNYMIHGIVVVIIMALLHLPIMIDMYLTSARVSKDVGQEWTPRMAKRYRKYALVTRLATNTQRPTLLAMLMPLLIYIIGVTVYILYSGVNTQNAVTNIIVMINMMAYVFQLYARVIIPAEPREKRLRQLRPAFNTIG